MLSRHSRWLPILLILSLVVSPVSAGSGAASPARPDPASLRLVGIPNIVPVEGAAAEDVPTVKDRTGLDYYIVRLADAPLALYRGGLPGLAATNPRVLGQTRLNPNSPASRAYRAYLNRKQDQAIAAIAGLLGRRPEVLYRYAAAVNGLAVRLTPRQAEAVRGLTGVVGVYRNEVRELLTDAGPAFIGATGIWDGTATGGLPGTKGEGVLVGILDTGINSHHPSFADVGGDGYDHTNPFGAGNYKGWCNPADPNYDPALGCNDKLVGIYSYTLAGNDPEDTDGHGSHTASTVAGNVVEDAVLYAPTVSFTADVSGVAPHANIIAYDVCAEVGCYTVDSAAAVDQAVLDGVDAINFSISGGTSPYSDLVSLAFLGAFEAGMFVSASAGNSGPGAGTVNHIEPWVQTVAASNHNRKFENGLVNMSGGGTTPPADLYGKSITAGYGPAAIVYAGDYGDPLCAPGAFAASTFNGEIVVCDRGTYARVDKGQSVLDGGAGGMILANDAANGESLNADTHFLPAVHISYDDGVALKAWLASGAGHTGTIAGTTMNTSAVNYADVMAAFSSRGPGGAGDVIKPDITAPGVDVWAAFYSGYSTPPEFNVISGTSMSSPHSAGSAALVRALHPDWSAAEVKSAIMLTGVTDGVTKEDADTPADPFDMGAGRVDLTRAGEAGFVLDETAANMAASDPNAGGDPTTLNLASLADGACFLTCTWTRTLTSTQSASVTWNASASSADGVALEVSPSSFSLGPGGTQVVTITADVTGMAAGQWYFGEVGFAAVGGAAPDAAMPVAVYPVESSDPAVLTKSADVAEVLPGGNIHYTLQVSNPTPNSVTYTVTDPIPANTTYVDGSATGGLVYDPGANSLSADVIVDGTGIAFTPGIYSNYVGLAQFGVPPLPCSSSCDETRLGFTGMDFDYMGQHYTTATMVSNGYMVPGTTSGAVDYINQHLPDSATPNNVLSAFWADLDLDGTSGSDPGGGTWYAATLTDGVNDYDVFEWEAAELYEEVDQDPGPNYTFQIWFQRGTPYVWYAYGEFEGGLPAGSTGGLTVGAEDSAGTVGGNYFYRELGSDGAFDEGTPPEVGTDILVEANLAEPAVFTFDVTAGTVAEQVNIVNVAEADDGLGHVTRASATTALLPLVEAAFGSTGSQDGLIRESTETSGKGGLINSRLSQLGAGDDARDRQVVSILSFSVNLPAGAQIVAAEVRVRRIGVTGGDPFLTHGSLVADLKNGFFGQAASLEKGDFQAAATFSAAGTFGAAGNGEWSVAPIDAGALSGINANGTTQVRVRFTLDDNDDLGTDLLRLYSGNAANAADRPQLVIYYLP